MNPDPPQTAYSGPKPPHGSGESDSPVIPIGPAPSGESVPAAESTAVFWGWWDVFIALGLVLPSIITATFLLFIPLAVIYGETPPVTTFAMPAQLLGYTFWLVCLWVIFRFRHGRPLWKSLHFTFPPNTLRYLALGPLLALMVGVLGNLLRAKEIDNPMIEQLLADPVQRLLFIVFAISFGPICEEMFFRGLTLPVAIRTFGVPLAILLTSVPFALIHGPQYSWSWQHLFLLALAGAVFGYVRVYTGSTAAAALTHCAYNLTMFGGFFLNGRNH